MFLKKWEDWIAVGVIFWLTFVYPENPDLLHQQAYYALLGVAGFFSFLAGRELRSKIVGYALAYFLFVAISDFADYFPTPKWARLASADSFIWLSTCVGFALLLDKGKRERALDCLAALCLLSSAVVVGGRITGGGAYFILNNSAADACFIAVLLPLVVLRTRFPKSLSLRAREALSVAFILLPVTAIAVSGSSTALVALAFLAVLYAAQYRKRVKYFAAFSLIGAVVMGIAGFGLYLFSPDAPFSDSGRVGVWKSSIAFVRQDMDPAALGRFQKNASPELKYFLDREGNSLSGMGAGAFLPLAAGIQEANSPGVRDVFPFAHSEPVEIFFTNGYIGLAFALAVLFIALTRALDCPYLFAAVSTYALISLVQFPFRYYGSALAGAIIFREALALEGTSWKNSVIYLRARGLREACGLRAVLLLAGMFPIRAKVWDK